MLPASLVYDGIGQLLVELSLPADETEFFGPRNVANLLLGSVIGLLGSYAVAHGLWRIACGERPTPGEIIAAPWREARWAVPMAFLLSAVFAVGVMLGGIPGILAWIFFLVAAPVAAVEHRGGFESLRRAFRLGQGFRLRATGIFLVSTVCFVAAGLPLALFESPGAAPARLLAALLGAVVALFGDTLAFLFYAELRVRKESFDLELLARSVEQPDTPEP